MSTTARAKTGARVPTARVRQRHRHRVDVVEPSDRVWNEPRFRRANPDYRLDKPCVYVGMTGLDPDLRFDKHKAGIKANRFVLEYGLRLLPHLYEVYNPMPFEAARDMEVELAIRLREAGYQRSSCSRGPERSASDAAGQAASLRAGTQRHSQRTVPQNCKMKPSERGTLSAPTRRDIVDDGPLIFDV